MDSLKLVYPTEKLAMARRMLMAPHPKGENESFVMAFHECDICMSQLKQIDDEHARDWIETIRKTIDVTGLKDPNDVGLWAVKVERLTVKEKAEFSNAVDELSSWVGHKFFGHDNS